MIRSARELMATDHEHLAAWTLALRHSWEPNRGPHEPDELPWVEDMVEAAFVLLGLRFTVHDADTVATHLRATPLGRTYLAGWYMMTCSQYGQLAVVGEE